MKLTEILNLLYEKSDYGSRAELASAIKSKKIKVDRKFLDNAMSGSSLTVQRLDLVFDKLTKDISAEQLYNAIELIRSIRKEEKK